MDKRTATILEVEQRAGVVIVTIHGNISEGEAERVRRALRMVEQMDDEGFGDCSNHGECEAVCPKEISIQNIARMRREFVKAAFKG